MSIQAVPCWVTRHETDPRYDPSSPSWAPDPCNHEACMADDKHCGENAGGFHDWSCASVECLYNRMEAMCDLDKDHDGEHAFVSPDEILLVFPASEPPPTAAAGAEDGARL